MGFLAAIPLVLSAVGAGVSAVSSMEAGDATSAADAYRSQVAANNAKISQQNADMAIASGEANVQTEQRQSANTIANTRAIQGASGLDVNKGSQAAVQTSENELGNLDALTIRNSAARTAYGYESQGINYQAQSGLEQQSSGSDQQAGFLKGIGSIISGASSTGSMYNQMALAGAGGM